MKETESKKKNTYNQNQEKIANSEEAGVGKSNSQKTAKSHTRKLW